MTDQPTVGVALKPAVTITANAKVTDEDGRVHEQAEKTWTDLSVMKVSLCRAWCTRTANQMAERAEGVRFVRASFYGFCHDNMVAYSGGVRLLVQHGETTMRHLEGSMER